MSEEHTVYHDALWAQNKLRPAVQTLPNGGAAERECPDCHGAGYIPDDDGNGPFAMHSCPTCRGTGKVPAERDERPADPVGDYATRHLVEGLQTEVERLTIQNTEQQARYDELENLRTHDGELAEAFSDQYDVAQERIQQLEAENAELLDAACNYADACAHFVEQHAAVVKALELARLNYQMADQRANAAERQLAEARAQAEALNQHSVDNYNRYMAAHTALERLEWRIPKHSGPSGEIVGTCSGCFRVEQQGHAPDCWLDAALHPKAPQGGTDG